MSEGTITEGLILTGVMFNEPMRVVTTRQSGTGTVIAGLVGQNSGQFREVTLTAEDIAQLNAIDPNASYDGDGELLKLALQAYTLGIAHEFDPPRRYRIFLLREKTEHVGLPVGRRPAGSGRRVPDGPLPAAPRLQHPRHGPLPGKPGAPVGYRTPAGPGPGQPGSSRSPRPRGPGGDG